MKEDEFLKLYAQLTGRAVDCEVALDDAHKVRDRLEDEYKHAPKDERDQLEPELDIAREEVQNCEYDLTDARRQRDELMNTWQQQTQARAEGREESSTNYLASAVEGVRMGTAAIGFMANATINPQSADVAQLVSASPPEVARQAEDIVQQTSAWSRETGLPADRMQTATARSATPEPGEQLTKLDEQIEEQNSRLREAKDLSEDPRESRNAPKIPDPNPSAQAVIDSARKNDDNPRPKDDDRFNR